VEFPDPKSADGHWTAGLRMVSVSGFAFEATDQCPRVRGGDEFRGVTLRIGECVLEGDIVVRYTRQADNHLEVGCLFYPGSREWEDLWMTLLAGIDAAKSDP
jgi:hypothetical protein